MSARKSAKPAPEQFSPEFLCARALENMKEVNVAHPYTVEDCRVGLRVAVDGWIGHWDDEALVESAFKLLLTTVGYVPRKAS